MTGIEITGQAAFLCTLIYASVQDVYHHLVTKPVYVLLITLCGIRMVMSPAATAEGILLTGLPLLIAGLIIPDRLGGGDIKFSALCGGIVNNSAGISALFIGLTLCLITICIAEKIKKHPLKSSFVPLIPFLSVGFLVTGALNL